SRSGAWCPVSGDDDSYYLATSSEKYFARIDERIYYIDERISNRFCRRLSRFNAPGTNRRLRYLSKLCTVVICGVNLLGHGVHSYPEWKSCGTEVALQ